MPNPYDALRDAAEAMAAALREDHSAKSDSVDSCPSCAALAEYAKAMGDTE